MFWRKKKPSKKWEVGSVFLVPLSDGDYAVGQVIGYEYEALGSVVCVFSNLKLSDPEQEIAFGAADIISALFVTTDALDRGSWEVAGKTSAIPVQSFFDIRALKRNDFIGVTVRGSGIVRQFLNAYFGLAPWDCYYRPDYLDELLLSPEKKPSSLRYKSDFIEEEH